jgi:hypothetical protein
VITETLFGILKLGMPAWATVASFGINCLKLSNKLRSSAAFA